MGNKSDQGSSSSLLTASLAEKRLGDEPPMASQVDQKISLEPPDAFLQP